MPVLPIDRFIPDIRAALQDSSYVVLKAEPGAGKTTQVPKALLENFQRVLVVQPRRLAAKLAAEWIAEQLGQKAGELVGYQIRLDNRSGPKTRLLFVTEGVLTRKLLHDPLLNDFDLIILDEFHERHIHTDIALALLRNLQVKRPELKLLVMSATLDTKALVDYLDGAKVFEVPGRTYPVSLEYLPGNPKAAIEDQVLSATQKMLIDRRCTGNILIFLSGLSEIQRCLDKLRAVIPTNLAELIPLSAELAHNYQLIAANPAIPKIILSTNVAETSVTLPRVTGVIDPGRAKISGYAPWSGLPTLEMQKISQASAVQRMGRAGRIASGVCYRLYSLVDFNSRPKFTEPEIKRIDLCQSLLEIQAIHHDQQRAWESLPWFELPDDAIMQQNVRLLQTLSAFDEKGHLTADGRFMTEFPLHPRLARIILEGKKSGVTEAALLAAILISEGMPIKTQHGKADYGDCDVCCQIDLLIEWSFDKHSLSKPFIEAWRLQRIRQLFEQLRSLCGASQLKAVAGYDRSKLRRCIFAGFADRVAKYRPLSLQHQQRKQRHFNFCLGRSAILDDRSVVMQRDWIVAIEAREILSEEADSLRGRIFVATAIDPEWLIEDPFHLLESSFDVELDEKSGRGKCIKRNYYARILLEEQIEQADPSAVSDLFLKLVQQMWPKDFQHCADWYAYQKKLEILNKRAIQHKLPVFQGVMLDLLLSYLCDEAHSLSQITGKNLRSAIEEQLDYADLELLQKECPDRITLKNGKQFTIHYEEQSEPWIEGRIQEFFGQDTSPTICGGRQPLLLKLLAPNRRPAQITADLTGFWQGSYHEVKKELKRRYPKHSWPDDPARAAPDERRPRT